VNGDNARMLESSQYASFADKAIGEVAVCSRNVEYLQGHAALKILVFRGVHNAHATARNALQQAITRAGEIGGLCAVA